MRVVSRILDAAGLLLLAGCGSTHLSAGVQQPVLMSSAPAPTTVAAMTSTPAPTAPTASAVPWIDTPASEYVEPVDTGEPPAYRPCSARDLSVPPVTPGPAAGTDYAQVRLVNRSSSPCSLAGEPDAVLEKQRDGSFHAVGRYQSGAFPGLRPGAANLDTGQAGALVLAWTDGCPDLVAGGHDLVRSLTVELADRTRVTVPLASVEGPPSDIVCGVFFSRFGPVPPPPEAETSPLDVLTATSDLPAQVTAGQVVHFHVTLLNGSDAPVRLDPCPSYFVYVGVPTVAASRYFFLNCASAPALPAHGSVTFAMQFPVPDAVGSGKFGWFLQRATVGVGREVTVVPGR